MASRKQRRRREKLQRHEYEYVVETEEGEEVSAERLSDLEEAAEPKRGSPDGKKESGLVDRRGRPVPKPSLERVLRRAVIFAPLVFVFVYATARNELTIGGVVLNTLFVLAFLLPFVYLVDSMVYRLALRRYGPERTKRDKRR
jgi:hypothetical protein